MKCVKVDPAPKPSRQEVIERAYSATPRWMPPLVAEEVEKALVAWEADTPEPTYRIELSAAEFRAVRSFDADIRQEARRELWAMIYDEAERSGLSGRVIDVPIDAGYEYRRVRDGHTEVSVDGVHWWDLFLIRPDGCCPSDTVTAEELAEAWHKALRTAGANRLLNDWADMVPAFRGQATKAAAGMLARFFPEHVAKPAEPEPVIKRCDIRRDAPWPCVRPKGHPAYDGPFGVEVGCSRDWRPEDGPEPIAKQEAENG